MFAKLVILFGLLAVTIAAPQYYSNLGYGGYSSGYPGYYGYSSYSSPLAYSSYGSYGGYSNYPYTNGYGYY